MADARPDRVAAPPDPEARMARALQAIERLQARLQQAEAAPRAPIAVLGMACRYPGGADSPAAFWQLLDEGRDAIGPVPPDRWDADALHDPDPAAPGRIVTREGGFVPAPDLFDAAFFGIAPREAASLDPQQRLLLELAWHALEDAALPPPTLAGRAVGVFVGISSHDYSHRLLLQPPEAIDAYLATGNAHSVAAGRLSYTLGLTGPSVVVDTACSSSLVALHQACQSLRAGECDLALVGGVNRILSPAFSINFSRARMLAPDGRCKAFSARADGFGRGEGGGLVVLQRLADAQREGRRVWAVVRGSAVNQDGRSSGLTVPNGPAQQAVIRQALRQAGLAPADIDCVEAHGTGTALGDPIEAAALAAVYGEGRPADRPLLLGAVKANVGHLEAAAGLCGFIKTVLSLQHGRVPRQLHAQPPSPHIDWAALPLQVPHDGQAWPAAGRLRRAGVSSFGFSGTNAHVVVEEAPPLLTPAGGATQVAGLEGRGRGDGGDGFNGPEGLDLLCLSARDTTALRELARAHAARLAAGSPWRAHCRSARQGRAGLPQRLALLASSAGDAAARLQAWADGARGDADRNESSPAAANADGAFWQGQAAAGGALQAPLAAAAGDAATLAAMAQRYVAGADWATEALAQPVDLPLYPFQRQRYWVELPAPAATSAPAPATHPLLGAALPLAGDAAPRFESRLAAQQPGWAAEHTVFGHVVLPAAGLMQMALAASGGGRLHDLVFMQALTLDAPRCVQTLRIVEGQGDNATTRIDIHSRADDEPARWVQHASARSGPLASSAAPETAPPLPAPAGEAVAAAACLQRLAQQGVAYGPAFGALRQVWRQGPTQVLARLELPASHGADLSAWSLHPVLLDAALQSLAALFVDRAGSAGQAWLPAAVSALQSSQALPRAAWSLARLRQALPVSVPPEALHADLWLYDDEGRPCATLQGLLLRPASAARLQAARPLPLLQLDWVEVPPPARPSAAQLQAAAAGPLQAALQTVPMQRYVQLLPELDRLAARHAAEVMAALGTAPVPAALQALARRLQLLAAGADGQPAAASQQALAAAHPEAAAELSLLQHCAQGLPAVLRAALPPMALLFAEGRGAQLQALYGESPGAALANRLAADAAEAWARGGAAGRSLRVLEIGAGTGGSTAHVLPRLQQACGAALDYHFSDVSATLLDQARARFGPALQYHRFDVEQDPAAQGLARGAYDLVLAANVLHATADLRQTLAHVQALLAPGGLLLLLELTRPLAWLDLIFGLSDGWWRFADHDLRPDHALLPAAGWLRLLQAEGWGGAAALTAPPADAGEETEAPPFAVLAATRAAAPARPVQTLDIDGPAAAVLPAVQALLGPAAAGAAPALHLLARGAAGPGAGDGPQAASAWGLARVLQLEHPERQVRRISLDPLASADEQAAQQAAETALDDEPTVAWFQHRRYAPRLQPWPLPADASTEDLPADANGAAADWAWTLAERGTPDGLRRLPLQARAPAAGELQLRVLAAGLNMIDVLDCLGVLPFERGGLGVECAAEVVAVGAGVPGFAPGDAVIALAPGCWRSSVTVPAAWVAPRPRGYSAAAAAALPAAGLTAWHALVQVARLQRGERVLIHAAAGGTGWAALTVAQHLGARVHASASRGKWARLQARAGVEQLLSSRTLDFRDQLLAATAGDDQPGVHVVLNALSGDFIPASLACLKPGGRFIEIGKRDIWTAKQVRALRPDVQYHCVDLMALAQAEPGRIAALFDQLVPRWSSGALAPLPLRVWPMARAADAVRTMQRAAHVGKLVLQVEAPPPRVRADASYLVTGGFGGLGLATAEWLVQQGARHLVLLGRQLRMEALPPALQPGADGLQLQAVEANVADEAALQRVLQQIGDTLPPLRGVFHAAGHLHDGALRSLSAERLHEVLAPKLDGAWLLHRLTRALPLDFFVLYSSVAALFGSPGQAAHVAANTGLDALAEHRRSQGLPAISLQWGPWADIGAAADAATLAQLRARGIRALSPAQGLAALAQVLASPPASTPAVLGVVDVDWPVLAAAGAARDPLFQRYADRMALAPADTATGASAGAAAASGRAAAGDGGAEAAAWRDELSALAPAQRQAALQRRLQTEVAAVLGAGLARLPDPALGFFEMGLDSLMAVELRNRLARLSGVPLTAAGIFEHPTIQALAAHLAAQLWPEAEAAAPAGSPPVVAAVPAPVTAVPVLPVSAAPVTAASVAAHDSAESLSPDDQIAAELAALDALLSPRTR